ncbi:hypothetical protein DPMN_056807 [Dreissena polymorpha]|nr:hypothetical protein DPMN_056807 [Dreissena polymorpha]
MKEHTLGCYPLTVAALGFHQNDNYKDTGAMYTVTEKLSLPLLWKRIRNEGRFRWPENSALERSSARYATTRPQHGLISENISKHTARKKHTFAMCAKPPINT